MIVGTEWLIEAAGCDPEALRNLQSIRNILDRVVADLGLKVVGDVWHKFPGEGGVTGLVALSESHLACHTYPEYQTATFNLYCCRTRPEWDWERNLTEYLNAGSVSVTKIERGGSSPHSENQPELGILDLKSEISELNFEAAGVNA
jgi:S-adenosylmethionine decarboxylase